MTQEQPNPPGGVGATPDRATRWQQRQHLRVLEEAVYNGWQIPPEAAASLPREVLAIASDPNASPRDRVRATELLADLRKADIEAAVQLDRINRLDAGTATDRVEVLDGISDAQLAAVARVLKATPACKPCRKPKRKP